MSFTCRRCHPLECSPVYELRPYDQNETLNETVLFTRALMAICGTIVDGLNHEKNLRCPNQCNHHPFSLIQRGKEKIDSATPRSTGWNPNWWS